jgi:4-amino-4-deoxy-L-arabinose transferase-like glycosyltransferase
VFDLRAVNWAMSATPDTISRRAIRGSIDPTVLVALMATCQVVAWTLAPALTQSGLPLDVVEGYMWGREWVIATYKHPAMPSWLLEISRLATGAVGWPAYLVSQLFIAATFVFVYLLGRDLLGPKRAAAGTLLLTGIAFYAWPTTEFNHNVAQMPFWAALPWALWRAAERKSIVWWALAGALAAGGIYAKLTTVLLLITLLGWMLWDRDARKSLATPGLWIGLIVFAALVAPLTQWLVAHDFAPLKYAASRSHGSKEGLHIFLLSLVINLVGMLVLLSIAGLIRPWARARVPASSQDPSLPPATDRAVRYLIVATTGPLALAVVGALVSGASLNVAWGSSIFSLAGILAIALASRHFDDGAFRRIAVCAAVLLTVLPLGYALAVVAWPLRKSAPLRVNWPQAEISKRFSDLWMRETGQPLRIVSGNRWIAGLVGVTAPDNPSILSGPDLSASPWITPERLEREGVLVVWNTKGSWVPGHLQSIVASAPVREERFSWRRSTDDGDIVIRYAIVPPKQGQR